MAIQINLKFNVGGNWINLPNVGGIGSAIVNTAEELATYLDPFRYTEMNDAAICNEQLLGMVLYDIEPGHYVIDKTQLSLKNIFEPIIFSLDMQVKKKMSMFIGLYTLQFDDGDYMVEAAEVGNEANTQTLALTKISKPDTVFCGETSFDNGSVSLSVDISPNPFITINASLALQQILVAENKDIFNKLIDDNTADTEKFFNAYGLKGRFTMPIDLTEYEVNYVVPRYFLDKPKSISVIKGGSVTFDLPSVTSAGIKAIGWEYSGKIYNQGESITIENISSNITINLVIEPKQSGIVIAETSKNVVYDKDSKYPNINWGYPNGINIGVKAKTPVNALMPTKLYLVWLKDDAFIARLGTASYGVSKMLGYGGFVSGAVGNPPIEYLYRFERYGIDRFDFLGVSERKNNADLIDHASQNSNFILHKIEEVKL